MNDVYENPKSDLEPEDVYRPPESELTTGLESEEKSRAFYVVSKKKMTVLFLMTVGLYGIYWFYAHWKRYKVATDGKIWPVPRGIFSIFFAHSLFSNIDDELHANKQEFDWSPSTLATLYVVIALVGAVFERMAQMEMGSPWIDILSLGTILPVLFILQKSQAAANLSQGDLHGDSNSDFSGANIVWMILGALFWVLIFLGIASYFL